MKKELKSLTEAEFNKLKETGLLKTIYPEAPENYSDIRGKRPNVLEEPDFTEITKLCEAYLDSKEDPEKNRFKNGKYYIFEQAIDCVYGKESDVWDFINSFDSED